MKASLLSHSLTHRPEKKVTANVKGNESSSVSVPLLAITIIITGSSHKNLLCYALLLFNKIFQVTVTTSPSLCVCVCVCFCLSLLRDGQLREFHMKSNFHCFTLLFPCCVGHCDYSDLSKSINGKVI